MIKPFNDLLLVELVKSQWATADEAGEQDDPRAGTGTVIAIPDKKDILYFGSFNWAFDASMFDPTTRKDLLEVMNRLIGKRIYWEKRADLGLTVEQDDKTYALIKISKVVGYE